MSAESSNFVSNWPNKIINFIGWFILLLGIYAVLKTTFNILYYEKYPTDPVIGFGISYPRYEEECYDQNNYPLYNEKGEIRSPSEQEKRIFQENVKRCLDKLEKNRQINKLNDIWFSFMLVFLGGGILFTKRFYLK
ncbi:MAG: hypothetical protein KatS3mg090_0128 [Patescibacteria group bacterium]|nr:MAG: hypothetical protein KatS3mg090_0128 [Patescibacteria group bacterium]